MRIFEPVPPRLLAPNAITALGMVLGFTSLWCSANDQLGDAAWLIALAALADKLDGTVARLLRATSEFGVQFDSFSDFCTFGLCPAALVYRAVTLHGGAAWTGGTMAIALTVICCLSAIAAAVRLARFNVTTADHPTMFQGLPTTVSGSFMGLLFLCLAELNAAGPATHDLLPWLLAALGALMVSNLPLPKLALPTGRWARAFFIVNIALVYVLVPLRVPWSATYGLVLATCYMLVGFGVGLRASSEANTQTTQAVR